MASPILLLALLVASVPASAARVGVALPGECARPLPAGKNASPCAAAAATEAGEFSKQRDFLLDQLGGLQAWTDEASSPARFVVVKDSAPADAAEIERTLKEAEAALAAPRPSSSPSKPVKLDDKGR